MGAEWMAYVPTRRDEVVDDVRYGRLTPDAAEATAAAESLGAFRKEPLLPEYDPMREPRWPLVMAVAWIAWRDLSLVRKCWPEFRAACIDWFWQPWNGPTADGNGFARHEGWELKSWPPLTTVGLPMQEALEKGRGTISPICLSIDEAKNALWRSLADASLTAEAFNSIGDLVDIPAREWPYLQLFEEHDRDVLKSQALNRKPNFTNVTIKRDDMIRAWPAIVESPAIALEVEPFMFEPVARPGTSGYVPLCSALHWVMTGRGTEAVKLADEEAWQNAVDQLLPLICEGDVQIIGLRRSQHQTEIIPGHTLALVKILSPAHQNAGEILLSAPTHIACSAFIDNSFWASNNDKLYASFQQVAAWSQLQVRKRNILDRWPRPQAREKAAINCESWLLEEMRASPKPPRPKIAFQQEAKNRFRGLTNRQFSCAWQNAVANAPAPAWSQPGRRKQSNHIAS